MPIPRIPNFAGSVERALAAESGAALQTSLRHDPFAAGWQTLLQLEKGSRVIWGIVVDCVPSAGAYRVSAGPDSFLWCSYLGSGWQPHGARELSSLPIGAPVFYMVHPDTPGWGVIIGADPVPLNDSSAYSADYIWQGSRSGVLVEPCHQYTLLTQKLAGGMLNWSDGRPLDQTSIGEWGAVTETGLAVFLDPFMAYLRASEETGFYAFFHDQLARMTGHDLQIRSALGELEDLDDESEVSRRDGRALYFWENLGRFMYADPARSYTLAQVQKTLQQYATLEPAYDDQQPFHRFQEFNGYLGQGNRRTISLPPVSPPAYSRFSDQLIFPGGWEEEVAADGGYSMRSSQSILITKRPSLPVPKQMFRPEDTNGDSAESGYNAASTFSGPTHHVTSSPALAGTAGAPPNLVRAAGLMDFSTYIYNWKNLHPFFYHTKDWYLPDESASPVNFDQLLPSFPALADAQYLSAPTPITLPVDHRYPSTSVYPNEAGLALLPDGGLVLYDGYGSELRMTGGSVWLTCPGDLWVQPGKNFNAWAGWDAVVRAQNSVDVTAANTDVRIKAENNFMALGGNNGCGGILLESRTTCPAYDYTDLGEDTITTGIVLKSTTGQVVCWGRDVVLWGAAGNNDDPVPPDLNPTDPTHGQIIMDTPNRIKMYADYIDRFIMTAAFDLWVDTDGNVTAGNEYWATHTALGGALTTADSAAFDGCVFTNGTITVVGGHIQTEQAVTYNYMVCPVSPAEKTTVDAFFTDVEDRDTYLVGTVGPLEVDADWRAEVWGAVEEALFSLRTVDQYRTAGLLLFEARWQQMARIGGDSMPTWTEPTVLTEDGYTYPHPGLEEWTGSTYLEQNWGLYVFGSGGWRSADRAPNQSSYENPSYQSTTAHTMSGAYTVVSNP